jgi:uncharacterized protein with PQ loop repeat
MIYDTHTLVISYLAVFFTLIEFVPHFLSFIREYRIVYLQKGLRLKRNISVDVLFFIAEALWTYYAILTDDLPLLIACIVPTILEFFILVLYFWVLHRIGHKSTCTF